MLVGPNRARYMLLMGKQLSAQEALDWGVVAEVLPQHQLVDRAWEIARELVQRPPLVLRYTRQLFTQNFKRAFLDELGHGLARETYAQRQFFPRAAGCAASTAPGIRNPGPTDWGPARCSTASRRRRAGARRDVRRTTERRPVRC